MKPAFVLGIDGLPYSLARRLIDQGLMPSLERLAQRGTLAQMHTTVPDFSCVAWTSFATGVNPGKHGVYGFNDFRRKDAAYFMPFATDRLAPPLWQQVGKAGGRSVVLNLPGTYPALPLRGKMAAGFVAPDFDKACYPADFADTLRGLGYRTDFDGEGGMADADRVLSVMMEVFESRKTAIRHLINYERWDLAIAVITETDRVQHFFLGALDDFTHPAHPEIRQFYIELDTFIGEVMTMLEGRADLYLVSDHGFAVVKHTVWLNDILQALGMAPASAVPPWQTPENASQTQVFVLDPGRFYINRANSRFPHGCVPEHEVAGILARLKEAMTSLRDPETGEPIINVIFSREEGFWGDAVDVAPDLVVAARHGYYLRAFRHPNHGLAIKVDWEGNHTWDDAILYLPQPMADGVQPVIWDVLPTVLAGMGVELPQHVDGRDLRTTDQVPR